MATRRQESLVSGTVERLLVGIQSGSYPAGSTLPSEGILAETFGVSRLTLREAVSTLRNKNVLRVRRGAGTYVNPMSQWSVVDSRLLIAKFGLDLEMSEKLIEARTIIERGACELAATRRTDEDLHHLLVHLEAMSDTSRRRDGDAFADADLAFHDVIVAASGNEFLSEMLSPIRTILGEARRQTSSFGPIRKHAISCHRDILAALRASDPQASAEAMNRHMIQTHRDFNRYVGPTLSGDRIAEATGT